MHKTSKQINKNKNQFTSEKNKYKKTPPQQKINNNQTKRPPKDNTKIQKCAEDNKYS